MRCLILVKAGAESGAERRADRFREMDSHAPRG